MSVSLSLTAHSSVENKEFKKHYAAVLFCMENELSFPKETSEFFKGKIGGDDLEDVQRSAILKYIENGVQLPIDFTKKGNQIILRVCDIPAGADVLIFKLHN